MRLLLSCFTLLLVVNSVLKAQPFSVLHYTETSGFDHNTRANSLAMLQALGADNDFTVTDDQTGSEFDSMIDLEQYDVVVFSNTSGDNILSAAQRANFETYIANGGSYLGIHAASDTYRHSTANGGSTGSWDFYAEMVGASVQTGPNHVSGTPNYDMSKNGLHPSTTNVPDPWAKNEEYYYWENGYYDNTNLVVLEVEETVGPNGQINDYDAARPTAWVRDLSGGGRMFYTALGHANSNFTSDQDFRDLIRDGLKWTLGQTVIADPEPMQTPYQGVAQTIPGLIESEWYDEGGQGLAYNDDGQSQGSTFRSDDNVDVVDKSNASNGLAIGYTNAGEWVEYTVDVSAGTYDIVLRYASNSNAAGDVLLTLDGEEIGLYEDIPSTGGWNIFSTLTIPSVSLDEATDAILRSSLLDAGNLDYDALTFVPVLPPSPIFLSQATLIGESKQYHKTTLSWNGPERDESPQTYRDYRLDVQILAPDGSNYLVPGYFAADGTAAESSAGGGSVWRCHFLPELVGDYAYTATLRRGEDLSFSADPSADAEETVTDSGTFSIAPTDKTGDDLRAKGKLEYVGEPHLRFSNGEYFLKVGANSPETYLEYDGFDNTPTDRDYATHIQDWQIDDPTWQDEQGKGIIGVVNYLAAQGLNSHYFMMNSAFGDGDDTYPWNSPTDIYSYDVSKLDQWQIVFDYMMTKGMMCNFVLSETENESYFEITEGVSGGFADARKIYYREMVARFGYLQATTWNIGEENGWAAGGTFGVGNTTQQRIDFADHLTDLLYLGDNVTVHNGPSNNDDIFDDLVGLQSYTGISYQGNLSNDLFGHTKIRDWVRLSQTMGRPWVVAYDEPYVGGGTYPTDSFRKNSLWAALTAGANGVEAYIGGQDITLTDYRSQEDVWQTLGEARRFFIDEEIPFWEMTNEDEAVGANAWCLAKSEELYLIYFKANGTSTLQLTADAEYSVQWYDAKNGGALVSGSITQLQGPGAIAIGESPTSSTDDDWLAVVRRLDETATCPADIDASGAVDINDFILLNSAFGTSCTGCPADITADGVIDIDDFILFNSAFGGGCD